jgi:hypothetical protein
MVVRASTPNAFSHELRMGRGFLSMSATAMWLLLLLLLLVVVFIVGWLRE